MNAGSPAAPFPWQALDFMAEAPHGAGAHRLNLAMSAPAGDATVLFLHGVLRNWRTFFRLLEGLRGRSRLIALDFRGHGRSDRTPGAYCVADYIEDALATVGQIDARRLVLHGHSLGAMVALAAAAEAPDRVHAIVLEDPPFSTMGERVPSTPLGRFFFGVRACLSEASTPDSMFERFSDIIVGTRPDGTPLRVRHQRDELARRFSAESIASIDPTLIDPIVEGHWLDGFDPATLARRVRCPVRLLQADAAHGGMLDDHDAGVLASLVPAATVKRIRFPGAGHSLHWSHPERLVEIISEAGG